MLKFDVKNIKGEHFRKWKGIRFWNSKGAVRLSKGLNLYKSFQIWGSLSKTQKETAWRMDRSPSADNRRLVNPPGRSSVQYNVRQGRWLWSNEWSPTKAWLFREMTDNRTSARRLCRWLCIDLKTVDKIKRFLWECSENGDLPDLHSYFSGLSLNFEFFRSE